MWDSHFKNFVFIWCVNYLIVLHIIVGIVLLYRFFFNKNFVLKINKDVFKNKCFCKIQSIRVNLFNGGICLNLILIHSELGMGHNSVVVSAHSVMCRGVDPTWWIHWVISHSSQLLTAGVTKAVGCVILSQTQCLLEVEVTTSEMYFSYSFSTTCLKSRPKSNVSLNEHDQKYVGPTPREENQFPKHGSLKLWLGFNLRYGFHKYLLDLVSNKCQIQVNYLLISDCSPLSRHQVAVSHDLEASWTESLSGLQLALVDIQAGEVQVPWMMVPSTQWSAWGDVCRKLKQPPDRTQTDMGATTNYPYQRVMSQTPSLIEQGFSIASDAARSE